MSGETVAQAIARATRRLKDWGVPDPGTDARRLMQDALGVDAARLMLRMPEELPLDAAEVFTAHVTARMGREPVSRILGGRLFYGRWIANSPFVLDPRPETECLVELALAEPFSEVLDLGTGSGCIALTLLAERPGAVAVATDISPDALETAEVNAVALGVADRVHFEVSDWFGAVGGTYDLIVSNPPYIHPDEMSGLAPEVLRFDPKIALTDTADGLTAYRRIAAGAPGHLKPGGRLLVEIGPGQGEAVREMFRAAGLEDLRVHPDLDGRDRVVSARRPDAASG